MTDTSSDPASKASAGTPSEPSAKPVALPTTPLAEGSMPFTPEQLLARLEARGVAYTSHRHEAVFTVEQANALKPEQPGAHSKNLFLRTKKGRMWLVSCLDERTVDLKWLGERLGGRLSFGSAERLARHLGVVPGAVTPFAILNDRTREVAFFMDRALLEAERVNFHPLVNHMTVALAPDDLVGFLEAEGRAPEPLDFPDS